MSAELTVRPEAAPPAAGTAPHPAHVPVPRHAHAARCAAVPLPRNAPSAVHRGPEVLGGAADVLAALAEVDELAHVVGLPFTARAAWVGASIEETSGTTPWAVLLRDTSGRLTAAAVFLDDLRTGRTSLAGTAGGYRGGFAARGLADAHGLGRAMAEGARGRGRSTAWELGPVPDDAVARAVAAGAGLDVHAGDPVPSVRRPREGGDLAHVASANQRKTLRKARNRIIADGMTARVEMTRDPATIEVALPHLAAAYRDRDDAHGLDCLIDTLPGRRRWESRLRALARTGHLELSVLTLDDEFAAYVVGVRDGVRLGVVEGRFLTRFSRYAPGRLLEADVLDRALADPAVLELDWMTGVAPDTLLAANHREDVLMLRSAG